jgi:hypothetical protein
MGSKWEYMGFKMEFYGGWCFFYDGDTMIRWFRKYVTAERHSSLVIFSCNSQIFGRSSNHYNSGCNTNNNGYIYGYMMGL